MKKRVLALLLAGAFVMQSSAALALEIDVSEDVIEEDIVLTEDTEEGSGLVLDETAPESEDATVEDDVQSITVQDTATSGTCGDGVYWSYADGTLTISGEGAMQDWYEPESAPWYYPLSTLITEVVIGDDVTAIGGYAFFALGAVRTAVLGKDVTRIGANAFTGCASLESINIPDGVTTIEAGAFAYCHKLNELVLPESVQSLGPSSLESNTLTLTVRNPDCQISEYMRMNGGIIRGHAGSTAETYAKGRGIAFEAIDTWDNGTVTTAPTCTEKGVKTYHCTNSACTATKTEDIDPIKHEWGEWKVTTPATCNKDGVETRTCKNDKTHTETRPVTTDGHKWGEWKVTTPATCTEDGVETRTCKNDSTHTETRKIPATGKHTYATTITKAKPGKDGSIVKKCTVCGKVESTTAISAPQKIVLSKTAYTYSGKAKNPTVTVKDAAGKTISSSNYTVSYATTRKSIGTHKVTVTFKGSKYEGSLSAKFVINPKAPSIRSASNLVKGIKVTWKPVSGITGYQIQLSTNKSFKNSKIISASKTATSKKITGLSTGTVSKKYYVRVRTYKKVSGNWYYSDWSSAKSAHAVKYSK